MPTTTYVPEDAQPGALVGLQIQAPGALTPAGLRSVWKMMQADLFSVHPKSGDCSTGLALTWIMKHQPYIPLWLQLTMAKWKSILIQLHYSGT